MTDLIEANGLQFYVRDQGFGAPVILLHGFPDTGDLWRNQVPLDQAARLNQLLLEFLT